MAKKNILQNSRGFTLLEVLVALAIIAIAVTYIIQLFSVNLGSISASGKFVDAAMQAEEKMRQILDGDLSKEQLYTETTDDGCKMDIKIFEVLPERTQNLKVKLMEIDLTVFWNKGNKEKTLTLSTQKMVDKIESVL
ncbi:type IV pilus modification PilV family protein [Desulfobacterium sp. N47]|uniref:Prepilin-type N-terminal cleavage/methylation domain-containing protein n=1 Tax=uncultured Desulfobacterium sp. TaxID=201089 RepID=E1YDL5_9BACT|nr:unknown protein [uncultured Desulfobacterium sp.]